jgi:hypothetical protein
MNQTWSKPAAGKAGIAPQLKAGSHWPARLSRSVRHFARVSSRTISRGLLCAVLGAGFWQGCAKPPSSSELEGTWIPTQASLRFVKDTNECRITLEPGHAFHGAVPDYLMKTSDQSSGQVMVGKGRWSVSTKALQTDLQLDFDEVDGQRIHWGSQRLIVERTKSGIQMFSWIGEEGGDRLLFERAP